MASGMGGQPQPQPTAPSQGQASTSMSMNVSPEKRSALKNYFDGYKDAIQRNTLTNQMSESMDQLLPNISSPQMPMQQPMMPQQPPMMMNMGGAVDVFEPQYMSNGGFTSNISVGDGDTIGGRDEKEKDENNYVESLLSQYDDMYAAPENVMPNVNVGMMSENRDDVNIPMQESTFKSMEPGQEGRFLSNAGLSGEMDPQDNLGSVQSPFETVEILPGGEGYRELLQSYGRQPSSSLANIDLTNVAESGNPKQGTFEDLRAEIDAMGPFERGVGSFFAKAFGHGVDDQGVITPAGLLDFRNQTQATAARNQELEDQRRKDQDDRERQLAEEQRMRALIQSMMPAAPEAAPTEETAPIAETPPVADPVNYQDVVVPSDRVPNFSIPPLPVLPSTSPLLPQGISPELLRNLFKLQGVPASQMNQGGSVNKLDTAVDNFLSSVR